MTDRQIMDIHIWVFVWQSPPKKKEEMPLLEKQLAVVC